MYLLAELTKEQALQQGVRHLALIVLIGVLAMLVLLALFVVRRMKRRELASIEQSRAARRAGSGEPRVDAWQASSDRYIDHDKLPEAGPAVEPDDPGEAFDELGDEMEQEDDPDPYGLFRDTPYQDPDDEDGDDDEEDDEADWDAGRG